ncbi:Uncharacterized protein PBTT_10146 [Plasmodiophora brassicae]|uniref:Uncharacterized protein n=1 Tax=Plasmodiophora brassicae TaxID=37360 RepID=A0A0G4INR8_PLABS|nr:hypothetical protein PBRA_005490 [Plasmodiophora brassicae]SPR01844.1 unnamed protein product [Plasmodiophora brassicae]
MTPVHLIVALLLIIVLLSSVYVKRPQYLTGSIGPRLRIAGRPRLLLRPAPPTPSPAFLHACAQSYQRLLELSQEQFTRAQKTRYWYPWTPARPDFNATIVAWHDERRSSNLSLASDDDVALFTEIARTGTCTNSDRVAFLTHSNISLPIVPSSSSLLTRLSIPSFGSLRNRFRAQPVAPYEDVDAYRALRDLCLATHKTKWNPFAPRIPSTFDEAFQQWNTTWTARLQHELRPEAQAIEQLRQLFNTGSCDDRRPIARLTSSSFLAPSCTDLLHELHVSARQAFEAGTHLEWTTLDQFDSAHGEECALSPADFNLFAEVASSGNCDDPDRYKALTGVSPDYMAPDRPDVPRTWRDRLGNLHARLPQWTRAITNPYEYVQDRVETVPVVRNMRTWYNRVVNAVNRTGNVIRSPGHALRGVQEAFVKGNLATKTKIVMTAILAGGLSAELAVLSGKKAYRIVRSVSRPLKSKTVWIPAAVLSSMFVASKMCNATSSLRWACSR